MRPRRSAPAVAGCCGPVVLITWVVAQPAGVGSTDIENIGAMPREERRAASLETPAEFADAPQALVVADAVVADTDVAPAVKSVTDAASDATLASDAPASVAVTALSDSAEMLQPQSAPEEQAAT